MGWLQRHQPPLTRVSRRTNCVFPVFEEHIQCDHALRAHRLCLDVMCVSLLRLQLGEIALNYRRKDSQGDCGPVLRPSRDEGKPWSSPIACITDEVGYVQIRLPSFRGRMPMACVPQLRTQRPFLFARVELRLYPHVHQTSIGSRHRPDSSVGRGYFEGSRI
jgi:hypothetical protein